MLEAPPFPLLLRMASPNALAFLVQASVSMAEAWFIARLGTAPLAAIALMFPALMLMQMLANGALGGAVSSAVARTLGRGDRDGAEALVWHALAIAAGAALLFTALYFACGPWLLARTGAPGTVTDEAARYGALLFAGTVPIWTTAFLSSVIRGSGNMKLPALLMIGSSALQVPLSGALILGWFGLPALGLVGSAIALLVVATLSTLFLICRLLRSDATVRLNVRAFGFRRAYFADIFRVGLLAALSPLFVVLTISALNVLIGRFGVAALAGYGIVARLEFLLVPMIFGIGAALTAMVGVNMGAGNVRRAERIGWLGGFTAAGLTGAVGLLLALAPGLWLDLFTDDPDSWRSGALYLGIVGPVFLFQGLGLSLYFASQGAGTVAWPVIATVLRFVVCVGGALVGVGLFDQPLGFVYACIAAGMVVYGALTAAAVALGAWRRRGAW
jgi:putative MATE family efflux protein